MLCSIPHDNLEYIWINIAYYLLCNAIEKNCGTLVVHTRGGEHEWFGIIRCEWWIMKRRRWNRSLEFGCMNPRGTLDLWGVFMCPVSEFYNWGELGCYFYMLWEKATPTVRLKFYFTFAFAGKGIREVKVNLLPFQNVCLDWKTRILKIKLVHFPRKIGRSFSEIKSKSLISRTLMKKNLDSSWEVIISQNVIVCIMRKVQGFMHYSFDTNKNNFGTVQIFWDGGSNM